MNPTPTQVCLVVEPIDMRAGIDGLSQRIQNTLGRSPCDGTAYAFRNRRQNRPKLLIWDGTGVWLLAQAAKLYPMGFREPVARSTLADANESRDWRIREAFAGRLITQARELYLSEDLGIDLSNTVYALDSTTIDLCLLVFP